MQSNKEHWILTAMVFAATVSCSSDKSATTPKNIFGSDSRQELDVTKFPGKAVARLDGGCSAAMIGPQLALTAAHCIFDSEKVAFKTDVKYLKAGYKDGKSVASSWINQVWIGSQNPEKERKNDWAILALSDDIGNTTGWFGVKSQELESALPMTVNLAGYSTDKDKGNVAQISRDCYLHKVDEAGRVLHDCDGAAGVSGGPLFTSSGSETFIVAITAAEFRTGDTSMTLDIYSHDYANIAVNVAAFVSSVELIKASLGSGLTVPDIPNVFHFSNLNSSAGDPDGQGQDGSKGDVDDGDDDGKNPGADPRQEPEPDPGFNQPDPKREPEPDPTPDPAQRAVQLRTNLEVQVSTNSRRIMDSTQIIINAAFAVLNYADYYAYQDLWYKGDDTARLASQLADRAWQLQRLQVSRTVGTNCVVDFAERLATTIAGMNACVKGDRNASYIARDLRAPIEDIQAQIEKINGYTTL